MEEQKHKYNPDQDYCDSATKFQTVPSFEQYHRNHPNTPLDKIDGKRVETNYSCPDNYRMGSIQDNQIYIPNVLSNSVVPENTADQMYANA